MHTLHFDTERFWRGGQRQLLLLLEGLARRGVSATLAAPQRASLFDRVRRAGFAVVPLAARNDADPFAVFRLAGLLRRERFDVIHCHTGRSHAIARLARPLVPANFRPRLVVSRRVAFESTSLLTRWKFAGVDRVLAVSEAVKQRLIVAGIDPARIALVRDGIPAAEAAADSAERERVRHQLHLSPANRLVLHIGHLGAEKGQSDLIAAAVPIHAAVPDARVVIVGGGKLRASLEREASAAGEARVLFAGFWPPESIGSLLAAAEVFVLPSRQEGLGSILLDAMSAGVPVVATSTGGIPEIVRDGDTGLLVPPASPAALAKAVIRLLKDPALAGRIAAAGRTFVREQGGADRMVEETLAVYRSLDRSSAF